MNRNFDMMQFGSSRSLIYDNIWNKQQPSSKKIRLLKLSKNRN